MSQYELVITTDGGLDADHALLLRTKLLADGFRDDAVDVRKRGESE